MNMIVKVQASIEYNIEIFWLLMGAHIAETVQDMWRRDNTEQLS